MRQYCLPVCLLLRFPESTSGQPNFSEVHALNGKEAPHSRLSEGCIVTVK